MRPVPPRDLPHIHQPQIGLVDQRSRLQRVSRILAPHVPVGAPVQFFVDERRQRIQRLCDPRCSTPAEDE